MLLNNNKKEANDLDVVGNTSKVPTRLDWEIELKVIFYYYSLERIRSISIH